MSESEETGWRTVGGAEKKQQHQQKMREKRKKKKNNGLKPSAEKEEDRFSYANLINEGILAGQKIALASYIERFYTSN